MYLLLRFSLLILPKNDRLVSAAVGSFLRRTMMSFSTEWLPPSAISGLSSVLFFFFRECDAKLQPEIKAEAMRLVATLEGEVLEV